MKKYLLDTHTLIWFLEGSDLLPSAVRNIITNTDNAIWISIATLWEIAIKISIGKLTLVKSLPEIIKELKIEKIGILAIEATDILHVSTMPFHHRDPFDRIIIAQALTNDMVVLSNDKIFDEYITLRTW